MNKLSFHNSLEKFDEKVFGTIYINCKKKIILQLRSKWKISWDEAEAAFQNALLLLLIKLKNKQIKRPFEAVQPVCAWLKETANNDIRNSKRKRKEESILDPAGIKSEEEDSWFDAIKRITREEINKMEEPCRSIILDWVGPEKYDWRELAEKYDKTYDAIRRKYSDCRQKLEKNVLRHPDFPG